MPVVATIRYKSSSEDQARLYDTNHVNFKKSPVDKLAQYQSTTKNKICILVVPTGNGKEYFKTFRIYYFKL